MSACESHTIEPGVGNIDFFAFDTHATNSIPMCSAEYADHNGAIGTLNTQQIAYKCPCEVLNFLRAWLLLALAGCMADVSGHLCAFLELAGR